jgi:hypothetical protein
MGRNLRVIAGWIVMGLGVLGLLLIPDGTGITFDNRGFLGPFDPLGPPPATYRVWLRLAFLGASATIAFILWAGPWLRDRSLTLAATGTILATGALVAITYPTGPPYRPPARCLPVHPFTRVEELPDDCRIYYSDHQPGPTYAWVRTIALGGSGGLAVGLLLAARWHRKRSLESPLTNSTRPDLTDGR